MPTTTMVMMIRVMMVINGGCGGYEGEDAADADVVVDDGDQ